MLVNNNIIQINLFLCNTWIILTEIMYNETLQENFSLKFLDAFSLTKNKNVHQITLLL